MGIGFDNIVLGGVVFKRKVFFSVGCGCGEVRMAEVNRPKNRKAGKEGRTSIKNKGEELVL